MAAKQLGNILITSSLLTAAVTATVCPVKYEIETRQASNEYYWDARFTSSNVVTVTTQSAVQCIQRCLKECLCYHANYKASKARTWECQLVTYSECGVKSGVRIEDDVGWSGVKLMKGSEDPFTREYCCKLTEPEQSMLSYCSGICTSMAKRIPLYDFSQTDSYIKWRCYSEPSLDGYYYSTGSLYCTRQNQLASIYNAFTSIGYKIGKKGQSCMEVCQSEGKICSSNLLTLNTVYLFHRLGVNCRYNRNESDCFTNIAHPVYYPETGLCHGYINVPINYDCANGAIPNARRLCKCVAP